MQEYRNRPYADELYTQVFNSSAIDRFAEGDNRHSLDVHHGIDVTVGLPNGAVITGQEKFLSHQYATFETLTVEYYQNQHTNERGDWFKLACQFYFVGYENHNNTGFCKVIIVNWLSLMTDSSIAHKWRHNANKDGRARATFTFISFNDIPAKHIIYRGG
jgi:hypothetical protein